MCSKHDESGWDREELAVAEQMLLGQAHVIRQVFPTISDQEMSSLFSACALWHDGEPIDIDDGEDELALHLVGSG